MTGRKEAIKGLLEKVEAGQIDTAPFWKLWHPKGDDWHHAWMAEEAANGSLDAAKDLHEEELPGWAWDISSTGEVSLYEPNDEGWLEYAADGEDDVHSRAWLIAILKALIAQEGDDD